MYWGNASIFSYAVMVLPFSIKKDSASLYQTASFRDINAYMPHLRKCIPLQYSSEGDR